VVVEPFTVIRNSVIMDDVNIKSHSHISNSVVAEGVKVGIGFMTDTTPSTVRLHEYSHSKQLGAIIGEDSTIGHGVVVNSGVIIGCRVNISSQKTIDRNVPNGTVIM
jgi:NDP-sugar pyrophosphorylase family protein